MEDWSELEVVVEGLGKPSRLELEMVVEGEDRLMLVAKSGRPGRKTPGQILNFEEFKTAH